jgi:DNA-binding NtrC family response regulator
MAHILVVDDEERMRHLLTIMLEMKGHRVEQAGDGQEALSMILNTPYEMVIADIKMPRMDGITLLKRIKEMSLPLPVVFITAFATVDSAVEAMREGAVDYITKPFEEERILLTVEKALSLSRIMVENLDLRQELKKVAGAGEIVFKSKEMEEVVGLCTKVAKREAAVLITGESGTGKEVIARFIHHASHRREERFVPVNCAAISPSLVESELFGHEKGAFTGADRRRQGKFEYATKGSLFMDEVGELPPEAQVKLLRALEEKKVQRVGGNEEIPVDVRVICATNQNLGQLVNNGDFRKDLFFRINVFPIHLPPLRERMDDIGPLAEHFLRQYSGSLDIGLTEGATALLYKYFWPGNVRELANAMERVVILAEDKKSITEETLSFLRLGVAREDGETGEEFRLPPEGISLDNLEKRLVKQALEASGNNQTAAAKLLGITRAKFRVMLKRVRKG